MSRRRPTASEALGAALAELGEDPHPEDVLEAVEAYYAASVDEHLDAADPHAAGVATDSELAVRNCRNDVQARRERPRPAGPPYSDERSWRLGVVS